MVMETTVMVAAMVRIRILMIMIVEIKEQFSGINKLKNKKSEDNDDNATNDMDKKR